MARDVERVLRAELEAAFDGPQSVGIEAECLRRHPGVPAQGGEGPAQGDEMPVHHRAGPAGPASRPVLSGGEAPGGVHLVELRQEIEVAG